MLSLAARLRCLCPASGHRLLLAGAVLLAGFVAARPAAAQQLSGGTGSEARTVSVVYDDSGSMTNSGKWWYSNYSLQALTGLLAEGDRLFVTRMSDPANAQQLELNRRANIIRDVREGYEAERRAGTPYAAVTTAMNALKQAGGEGPKHLVVLTDGQFETNLSRGEIRKQVSNLVAETGVHVTFLLIGQQQQDLSALADQPEVQIWQQEAQATVYEAQAPEEVTQRMRQIAADITSRALSKGGPRVEVAGESVTVTSEFPLRRLSLLEQTGRDPNRLSTLAGATIEASTGNASADALPSPVVLGVEMPDESPNELFGRITHLQRDRSASERVIPAGTMRLRFDTPVRSGELSVLPEVAARLSASLFNTQGRELQPSQSVYEVCLRDTLRMRATLIAPGGDTLTHRIQRPSDVEALARYQKNDRPMQFGGGRSFFETTLDPPAKGKEANVSVNVSYPGYFNFTSSLYTLRGVDCRPPRELALLSTEPWNAAAPRVEEAEPLPVVPLADSQRVSARALNDWSLRVVDDPGVDVRVERAGQGWALRPEVPWFGSRAPFFGWRGLPTGTFTTEVEITSPRDTEPPIRQTVVFEIRDISLLRRWLLPVLVVLAAGALFWYVGRLFGKKRFARSARIEFSRFDGRKAVGKPFPQDLRNGWARRWLWPSRAERKTIEDVTFEASRSSTEVLLPPETQSEGMRANGEPLDSPGRRSIPLRQGNIAEINKQRRAGRRHEYKYIA